jgi:hypothetical protein
MPTKTTSTISEQVVAEPLLIRLIVAPVLFVSFLVSLFLVDRQNYDSIFGRSGNKDGYYHSHQRKLAKREMDQAFVVRKRVIAAVCVLSMISFAVVAWGIESVWTGWKVGPWASLR